MSKVLLVTTVDIFNKNYGSAERIKNIIIYLKDKVDLTVLSLATLTNIKEIKKNYPDINIKCWYNDYEKISIEEKLKYGQKPIAVLPGISSKNTFNLNYKIIFDREINNNKYDFVIIEYLYLTYLLENIENHTFMTMIDTHDCIFKRNKELKSNSNGEKFDMLDISYEEEQYLLGKYNYILAIQEEEAEIFKQMGHKNIITVKHSPQKTSQSEHMKVGFLSNNVKINIVSLVWFINNVWKEIKTNKVLCIAGRNLCPTLINTYSFDNKFCKDNNILLMGEIENKNIFYDICDVIINPVKIASGLKIKSVEALMYAKPLIAPSEAVIGLNQKAKKAYIVANNAEEFKQAINDLENKTYREEISKNALKLFQEEFNQKKCYQPLVELLKD